MPNSKPIKIALTSPCNQPWENMVPCDQGRFCSHCQKTVIDFSEWSDTALYNFFSSKPGNVCGRFLPSQLNRNINIPPQPHSRLYRLTIALGLTLMIAQGGNVLAQSKAPLITQTQPGSPTMSNEAGRLYGTIWEFSRVEVFMATVEVFQNGELMDSCKSDFDGKYKIDLPKAGSYNLHFSSAGYAKTIIKDVVVRLGDTIKVNVRLGNKLKAPINIYHYQNYRNPEPNLFQSEDVTHLPTGGAYGGDIGNTPDEYQTQRNREKAKEDSFRKARNGYPVDGTEIRVLGGPDVKNNESLAPALYQAQRGKGVKLANTPDTVQAKEAEQAKNKAKTESAKKSRGTKNKK